MNILNLISRIVQRRGQAVRVKGRAEGSPENSAGCGIGAFIQTKSCRLGLIRSIHL